MPVVVVLLLTLLVRFDFVYLQLKKVDKRSRQIGIQGREWKFSWTVQQPNSYKICLEGGEKVEGCCL